MSVRSVVLHLDVMRVRGLAVLAKSWWAPTLVGLFGALGACGGSSVDRREGSGASPGAAGAATVRGGSDARGGSNPSGGSPARGGSTGTGGVEPECAWATDCPSDDLPCITCDDGEIGCAMPRCFGGICSSTLPRCPECEIADDCPPPPPVCVSCDDGSMTCAGVECHERQCLTRWSGCLGSDPCAGKTCGETCDPCNGSQCPSMELPYRCDAEGECTNRSTGCLGWCTTVGDCTFPGCELCGNDSCAELECIDGSCELVCDLRPYCTRNSDCDPSPACALCPDSSCAGYACVDGRCDHVCPE